MNSARNHILACLRRHTSAMTQAIDDRLDSHASGPLPVLKQALLEQFITKMTANAASVDTVSNDEQLVASIKQFLEHHQQPRTLCIGTQPAFRNLPWKSNIQVAQRIITANDLTVLTLATAAIAETGSIVMLTSEHSTTAANFLPDNFICVIRQQDIIAHMENLWSRLRETHREIPAVINIISGPSRTADVEQTIQLGAHGPRRMHVIIQA